MNRKIFLFERLTLSYNHKCLPSILCLFVSISLPTVSRPLVGPIAWNRMKPVKSLQVRSRDVLIECCMSLKDVILLYVLQCTCRLTEQFMPAHTRMSTPKLCSKVCVCVCPCVSTCLTSSCMYICVHRQPPSSNQHNGWGPEEGGRISC